MTRKRKSSKNEGKEEHELIKDLKKANRRLKSDNERLKSELNTLNQYFKKTSDYLNNKFKNVTLEDVLKDGIKPPKEDFFKLQKITESNIKCNNCGVENITRLIIDNIGTIFVCKFCKTRRMVRDEKEKE